MLGTPLGKQAFVEAHAKKRLEVEEKLLKELPHLSDLQCSWVLLSWSATPRANHTVRILPPSQSEFYATRHDARLWEAFCELLNAEKLKDDKLAEQVATLPTRLSGLGLSSAARAAPAAYWASWANSLQSSKLKTRTFVTQYSRSFVPPCFVEAQTCREHVERGS